MPAVSVQMCSAMDVEMGDETGPTRPHGDPLFTAVTDFRSGSSVKGCTLSACRQVIHEAQRWPHQKVGGDASAVAAAEDRGPFVSGDLMKALTSLGLKDSGTPSTVGRGWITHVTEDGQLCAHNAFTGARSWQAPRATHGYDM